MKNIKTLLVSALALAAVGFAAPKTMTASADTRDFTCTYSAAPKDTEYMYYGSSEVITYTAEEAALAGVPAGYENQVFEIIKDRQNNVGVLLDFSEEQVKTDLLESLQFRVYIEPHAENTGSRPQVRIGVPIASESSDVFWVHQPDSTPTPAGEWTTVTVDYSDKFENISKDGMLDKFELSVRVNASVRVYVDSIQYVMKANDGVAPVITYTGEDSIVVGLGSPLTLDVSAFDAQENCDVDVEYVWEEGVVLNENGTPEEQGTYTLTLQAKDSYGNLSTKEITVTVVESDNVAPVIELAFDTVKATVGTKPMLEVTATDNHDGVTLTKIWSDGALDARGRLTEGTHTWTLIATDAFGNKTEKTVTFIVTTDEPQYSFVTNEENLASKHTVTFDGENAIEITHGFAVDRPADPVKEPTDGETFTFIGWYYGDTEWDFSQPIMEDMNIESRWDVKKRLYRILFEGSYTGVTVAHGEKIEAGDIPADPEKEMDERYVYEFAGWYNGDTQWNFETDVVTSNMDLVAHFNKIDRTYTVTFDGKNAQTVKYGELLTEPATPEKEGYVFEGWYSGVTQWNFESHVVRSNVDLTSQWSKVSGDSTDGDASGDVDSDVNSGSNQPSDTAQPVFSFSGILAGCAGSIGGLSAGLTALGVAVTVLLKKKED